MHAGQHSVFSCELGHASEFLARRVDLLAQASEALIAIVTKLDAIDSLIGRRGKQVLGQFVRLDDGGREHRDPQSVVAGGGGGGWQFLGRISWLDVSAGADREIEAV